MARYGLANHVFVCRDKDHIVVLDVKRDRYFSLDAARTAVLGPLLPGWPAQETTASATGETAVTAEAAAAPLVSQGWLLEAPAGKEATPVQPSPAELELITDGEAPPKLSVGIVIAFVTAAVFAKFALRFWRFERVIRRVCRRRAKYAAAATPPDIEQARRLGRQIELPGTAPLDLGLLPQELLQITQAVPLNLLSLFPGLEGKSIYFFCLLFPRR